MLPDQITPLSASISIYPRFFSAIFYNPNLSSPTPTTTGMSSLIGNIGPDLDYNIEKNIISKLLKQGLPNSQGSWPLLVI